MNLLPNLQVQITGIIACYPTIAAYLGIVFMVEYMQEIQFGNRDYILYLRALLLLE
jgi:hypothetical protein